MGGLKKLKEILGVKSQERDLEAEDR